ncbi:KCNN (potassium K ChaNNel, calcium activated)-Like [Ditylenchus destructor]|uniref:KCNN (Potassium K ChaNNel, calcium activated)-Like n=1 Tax=Ditylenchus destructor TaxID=166010 RepID=A0AAD4R5G4_9BILA|nr:KCNN (potassium K ChaNNel, calcium activated)-Like [Ditylenchus destructor]
MPIFGPDGRTLEKGATVTTATPRQSYSGPLERRHNKSCDWSPPNSHNENGGMCGMCGAGCREKSGLGTFLPQNDAISLRSFNNPIAQVSSDILRVSGYTNQFKNLLTTRSRRESGPGGLAGCQQTSLEDSYYHICISKRF